MKLFYAPGACSLATRIVLHESGIEGEYERVDLASKITETGDDYIALNPKGSVPMLVLENGELVTENVAILALLAERQPQLGPGGPLGHTRLLETLSYLSSELHVAFHPLFHSPTDRERAAAKDAVADRLRVIEDSLREMYLFGPRFTVADAYLFVMLRWALAYGPELSPEMRAYLERVAERQSVRTALAEEGLSLPMGAGQEVVRNAA